jgi:hypothetical protein
MDDDVERVEAGGAGPQRLPVLLRILAGAGVNPAKLAVAIQYAHDKQTFWRLMEANLCFEHAVRLQFGSAGALEAERKILNLDELTAHSPPLAGAVDERSIRAWSGRMQAKFAGVLGAKLRGRYEEIHALTKIAPTTLRRYAEVDCTGQGGAGPQSVDSFITLLHALQISPAKLVIAAYYSGNADSFRTLLCSTILAEETIQLRTWCPLGKRTETKRYLLDEPWAHAAEETAG